MHARMLTTSTYHQGLCLIESLTRILVTIVAISNLEVLLDLEYAAKRLVFEKKRN